MNYKQNIVSAECGMVKDTSKGLFDDRFNNIQRLIVNWVEEEEQPKENIDWFTFVSCFDVDENEDKNIDSYLKIAIEDINETINKSIGKEASEISYWIPIQNLQEVTTKDYVFNNIYCLYTGMRYAVHVYTTKEGLREFEISIDINLAN